MLEWLKDYLAAMAHLLRGKPIPYVPQTIELVLVKPGERAPWDSLQAQELVRVIEYHNRSDDNIVIHYGERNPIRLGPDEGVRWTFKCGTDYSGIVPDEVAQKLNDLQLEAMLGVIDERLKFNPLLERTVVK